METYSNLEKLSNDLKNLFQNQKQKQSKNQNQNQEESHFDFEIISEQDQISFKTHKSILSSRSEYFKTLFNSKMSEYQEKITLTDIPSPTLFAILNYFYSGKIEINLENAIEILIFASRYLIDELIETSSYFIKNNLQMQTIVDVLNLSEEMSLNQLLEFCYQFISENFYEFIKTSFFLELEENHLNSILSNDKIFTNEFETFQSIIKWGKHKSNINKEKENQKLDNQEREQLQDKISSLVDKIRFIDFSKKEIAKTLKEELIPKQISQKLMNFLILKNEKDQGELSQFIQKETEDPKSLIFKERYKFDSEIIQEKGYVNKLKKWINDNRFFFKMKKGFSAKKDGFDCKKWHDICDNKGKTLVIIKTKDNFIFGGFTQIGFTTDKSKWREDSHYFEDGWITDPNSFIFSLRNDKNDRKSEKFSIKQTQDNFAVYYNYSNKGPTFGKGNDFILNSNLQHGYSNFGYTYNLPKGFDYDTKESRGYLAGSYDSWEVDELETYFI
ncbi:pep-cterm sorting domain-containing protein [Anaeramoeba ignava]|uniref:Pep-cterm sorting domain-containing protein n=1 Tax=Anaeramoeba ignava TaxID=1746090 RepID=A0A9Q0LV71_ANAIG|nr:pep-cterm sorting domain-containing protein [Anaeramoeba ignava]